MPRSHVWHILFPSGSKTDTSPGNCALKFQTHLRVCVPTTPPQKRTPGVYCADSLAGLLVNNVLSAVGVQQTSEEVNLGQAQSWTHWDTLWSKNGGGIVRDEGCGNQAAAIWGPLCKMKIICSGDCFFFLSLSHSLCLNKLCQKELLLWLSMERFPGMLDWASGMYGFNEPIWKLTEMKREQSGYITHRITTWVSAAGWRYLGALVSGFSTFQTQSLGLPAILGLEKSAKIVHSLVEERTQSSL